MASSSRPGTLPGNTITNPKQDLKGITTRSGVAYQGPTIPTPSKVVKRGTETDHALIDVHKGELTLRIGNEAITYNLDQTSRYSANYDQMTANKIDVTDEACEEYSQEVLGFSDITATNYNQMTANKIDVIDMACIEYSQEVLSFSNVTSSGNPTPYDDLIVSTTSPTLTLFGDSDFLLFEEADTFLGPPIPTQFKIVKQGTKVTKDQVQTPSSQSTAPVQPSVTRSETQTSVSEPVVAPKFYEIFKDMSFEISFTDALILMPKFASTLKALFGNKEKLSETARTQINEHCSAVILNKLPRKHGDPDKFLIPCEFPRMDECLALADLGASINLMPFFVWEGLSLLELTPTCMTLKLADRSVSKPIDTTAIDNPTLYDDLIVSTTSLTLFGDSDFLLFEKADAFLAILNSEPLPPLPNHEQYMPSYKKELKVCEAKTVKSSFDEPPESHKRAIARKLSDIKGIDPGFCTQKILMEEDFKPAVQHQRRVNHKIHDVIKNEVLKLLDVGLIYPISDSPWRCMMAIFHDMIEKTIEVFMDDFSVFRNSFQTCLSHLEKMLKQCKETNLCLNWEKSHFMVKEGIVLGHRISKEGIEVDKAKVDVIAKLPHPITVK
nr:hypothetical protein [Tanacetum cinerariifolium]